MEKEKIVPKSKIQEIKKHTGLVERITNTGVLLADIGWFNISTYNKVKNLNDLQVMDHATLYVNERGFILRVDIKNT